MVQLHAWTGEGTSGNSYIQTVDPTDPFQDIALVFSVQPGDGGPVKNAIRINHKKSFKYQRI